MEIRYDISDWAEEYEASGDRPQSADDAIDIMRESDMKLGKAALLLIVGREKGQVNDATLPSNKLSNLIGMSRHLSGYRTRQRATVKIKDKDVEVPKYISTVTTGEESTTKGYNSETPLAHSEVTTVDYNTSVAVERAIEYLLRNVVGRIRDRFAVIAYNDPKRVAKVAKQLKSEIDKMVEEFS